MTVVALTAADYAGMPRMVPSLLLGLPLASTQFAALEEEERAALQEFFALVKPFFRTEATRQLVTERDWCKIRAALDSLWLMSLTIFCPVIRCQIAFGIYDPELSAILEAAQGNPPCTQSCCLSLYGG